MDNLISVIVPIYNVEQYLEQCVNSILNQTYKRLEIILVDDGSLDRCPQICDEYAVKDSRIKVIHQKNGGLSAARNAGLDVATGDYIAFVDSDDWLTPQMYEKLMIYGMDNKADITECGYITSNKVDDISFDSGSAQVSVFRSFPSIVKQIVNKNAYPHLAFEVWNKIYKRSIIGDIRFKVGQIYEDLFFDRMLFGKCNSLVFLNEPLYVYRVNREGSTITFFNEKKLCKFSELDDYITDLEKLGEKEIANDIRAFGCGSAIDLYQSALKYGGSRAAREFILSYFIKYSKVLPSKPLSYRLFSLLPDMYCKLRTI